MLRLSAFSPHQHYLAKWLTPFPRYAGGPSSILGGCKVDFYNGDPSTELQRLSQRLKGVRQQPSSISASVVSAAGKITPCSKEQDEDASGGVLLRLSSFSPHKYYLAKWLTPFPCYTGGPSSILCGLCHYIF